MDESTRANTEGKETKAIMTFNKIARVTEELRICSDIAKSIKVKLYGQSPEETSDAAEVPMNPVFFDRLFDELHTLKNIVAGLKGILNETNKNL